MFHKFVACLVLTVIADPVGAHYHMLLPNKAFPKKGEEVTFLYQFGHPFEHEIHDVEKPTMVQVLTPDGKLTRIKPTFERLAVRGEANKVVNAYQFRYTPEQRGDHTIVVTAAPIKHDEKAEPIVDTVKVVIHVEAQKGWDATIDEKNPSYDLVPLTRPYGLRAGMLFRVAVMEMRPSVPKGMGESRVERTPVPHVTVEIEKYNAKPPAELPPDEHITYTVKTDAAGVAATTLPDAGWWSITAIGKKHRTTFWVWVDEANLGKPGEK